MQCQQGRGHPPCGPRQPTSDHGRRQSHRQATPDSQEKPDDPLTGTQPQARLDPECDLQDSGDHTQHDRNPEQARLLFRRIRHQPTSSDPR